jgi:hypothetical protein
MQADGGWLGDFQRNSADRYAFAMETIPSSQKMTPSPACMPHFLLTFGDARRRPVAAVIIEAPTMFQARVIAVVRRLAPGVPFGGRSHAQRQNDDGDTARRDRQDDVRRGGGGTDPSAHPGSR